MSEWLKEHAWKACVGETLPRVRIPLSPPISSLTLGRFSGLDVLRHRTTHVTIGSSSLDPPTFGTRIPALFIQHIVHRDRRFPIRHSSDGTFSCARLPNVRIMRGTK
jgi:hypothetical protein